MEIKENFEKMAEALLQYVDLKSDDVKLNVVEKLSFLCNDIISYVAVSVFAVLSFLFVLVAIVAFLSPCIGLLCSSLVVAALLAVAALLLYAMRRRLFVNIMVKCFCRIFFTKNSDDNE